LLVRGEEFFDLLQQDAGVGGLEQQLVGTESLPVRLIDRKCGKQRDGGMVRRGAGGLDDLVASLVVSMRMSVMTMWYSCVRRRDLPSRAEAAVSTSNPLISRTAFMVSRTATSSSTSRIRRFMQMIPLWRAVCGPHWQNRGRRQRYTVAVLHDIYAILQAADGPILQIVGPCEAMWLTA